MLIRIALWMVALCLPLFLIAQLFVVFTFFLFATLLTKFAAFLLLAAFGLLLFSGVIYLLKRIFETIKNYFSSVQRAKRRFLFAENRKANQQRLFHFKHLQLRYFKERQQRKWLEKNNREQIKKLADSIERELLERKFYIPKTLFSQFKHDNHRYRKQQNVAALLKLHSKISKFTSD